MTMSKIEDNLCDKLCLGIVEYNNQKLYVIGVSMFEYKYRLINLAGNFSFWAKKSKCGPIKIYKSKQTVNMIRKRGGLSRL